VSPHAIAADVDFDYQAALDLARRLRDLADRVDTVARSRQGRCGDALVGFAGAHADEFARRAEAEAANSLGLAVKLRQDADLCATIWKTAMDEENMRRYARHVQSLLRHRSLAERIWDGAFGNGFPPEPHPVRQPQPPAYTPTAELTRYPGPEHPATR